MSKTKRRREKRKALASPKARKRRAIAAAKHREPRGPLGDNDQGLQLEGDEVPR